MMPGTKLLVEGVLVSGRVFLFAVLIVAPIVMHHAHLLEELLVLYI